MKKLVLTALGSAFTVSLAYAAETNDTVTQDHIDDVMDQIEQLKTHVTTLEGRVNQQNQKISTQNQKIQEQQKEIAEHESWQQEMMEQQNTGEISTQEELEEADEHQPRVDIDGEHKEGIANQELIQGVRKIGVGTGHEFGLDSEDDGTQLLITAPQLNKDFNLLLTNQYLSEEIGPVSETGPRLQISGLVEAFFQSNTNPFGQLIDDVGNYIPEEKSDLEGSAEVDFAAEINDWWTGYIHFYSNTQPDVNVEMEQAFVVLGNLAQAPTYASAGLAYLSNGYFYTNMVTRPLTREIGRSRDNQALLGYAQNGLRASIFGFDSERTLEGHTSDSLKQWGGSFDYTQFLDEDIRIRVGSGYINDNSGAEAVAASNVLAIDEPIDRYIPSVNVHARLDWSDFIFFAEYQDNLRSFEVDEISYNGEGAKLSAANFEVTYNFDFGRPSWITGGYQHLWEGLGIQLPEAQYGLTYGVIVLKNTYLTFEYLLQQDYTGSDVATAKSNGLPLVGSSELNNQITAQVDLFF